MLPIIVELLYRRAFVETSRLSLSLSLSLSCPSPIFLSFSPLPRFQARKGMKRTVKERGGGGCAAHRGLGWHPGYDSWPIFELPLCR